MDGSRVPVENIYYLLCYAWRRLEGLTLVPSGTTPGHQAETLLTNVLCAAAERILARGLQRDYLEEREELRMPRGRFDLTSTFCKGIGVQRGVICNVADLRVDTALNRLLKATLSRCSAHSLVERSVRQRALRLLPRLSAVSLVPFDGALVRQLSMHRNVAQYRLLVEICLLLWRHVFPTEKGEKSRFAEFLADEQAMGLLFEQFVRNFIAIECPEARLASRDLDWSGTGNPQDLKWLPKLEMDIPIQWERHRTIVECKFYRTPWAEHYGRRTLHSGNLQQLYSYLDNDYRRRGSRARGALLYATGMMVRLDFELCDYPVSVRTLNLDQPWPAIDGALRALVAEWRDAAALAEQRTTRRRAG